MMQKQKSPVQIVITVTSHPILGELLWPYVVERKPGHILELLELGCHLPTETVVQLSEAEQKAITVSNAYSERNLMRVYSKEKVIAEFLKKLTVDDYKKHIRPFIDKKIIEMLKLIREERLPLYQHDKGSKILYPHNRIRVSNDFTKTRFSFEADENHFHYALECILDGKTVSLMEKKPVVVLTNNPANILLGNELHQFEHLSAMRVIPFTNKPRVSVDVSETDRYLEMIVLPILRYHEITWNNLPVFEEHRTCEPMLFIEDNVYNEPLLKLSFIYGDNAFPPDGKRKWAKLIKGANGRISIRFFKRDFPKEEKLLKLLREAKMVLVSDSYFKLSSNAPEKELTYWIMNHREMLSTHFHLRSSSQAEFCLKKIEMEQNINETRDWFEIHITVVIGEFRIPFVRFRKHILSGNREYILPNGMVILLPEEWFNNYAELFQHSDEAGDEKDGIRIRQTFAGFVAPLLYPQQAERITYQAKTYTPPPQALKAKLRQYQEDGFNWMIHLNKHHLGGCLADDMGLGKTLQTLALLQHMYTQEEKEKENNRSKKKSGKKHSRESVEKGGYRQLLLFDEAAFDEEGEEEENRRASLIVMPTSLLHNWRKEIARFTTLSVYEFTGNSINDNALFGRYRIILTSYGLMRKHITSLSAYQFEYVVLDESQHIKNSDSITFRSAVTLQGKHKLILTGTPIENSLKDLWSQFHFIQPDLLGDENEFTKGFITPIRQGNRRIEEKLHRMISPFILRRRKEEVAPELPPLTEEIVYCEMTDAQKLCYDKEKNSLRNLLLKASADNRGSSTLTVLNGITRLRQLASHPRMVFDDFIGDSGKIEEVISLFETLQSEGHKVLVFSSFVKHLELIAEKFNQQGWQYAMLTGASTNREDEIKRFAQSADIQAFFISLKAGGVGLNLTQADYVFIIDPWWNPAAELQAIGRAHRIGQQNQVFAYRFITEGSIEEKIVSLQEEKRKLSDTLITDNNPLVSLTDKEWAALI